MSHHNSKYKNENILAIILVGIFKALWFLITLPFKGLRKGKAKRISVQEKNYITEKRLEIEKQLNTENEIELKHLVMEADKLVDYTLQTLGYPGQTFADRLRSAESGIDRNLYNDIWQGHKVRNQIAHEQGLRISNQELRDAAIKILRYLKSL